MGKIILTPILVGLVGLLVWSIQSNSARSDKEFELALTVLQNPNAQLGDDASARVRQWAQGVLTGRLGASVPVEDVVSATRDPFLTLLSSQEAFSTILAGEFSASDIARDPRFRFCPTESQVRLARCAQAILRFIEQPQFDER